MRESMGVYRGQRKDDGEWMFGSLARHIGDRCAIMVMGTGMELLEASEVKPDTVGQLSGIKDDCGGRIFEHDICTGIVYGSREPVQGKVFQDEADGIWCLEGYEGHVLSELHTLKVVSHMFNDDAHEWMYPEE